MKSPEQPNKQEGEMANPSEGKEGLQSAIHALRETAERFHELDGEAEILLAKKDATGYSEKLKERATLLINLPDHLASSLAGVDQETRQQILREVSYFAIAAQEALKNGGFSLGVLLTHMGDKIGDKNDLERLIDSLENK